MSLSAYSLLSLEDLKEQLSVSGGGKDTVLESILGRVTDEIEQHLGRQIVSRGSLTEYHTFQTDGAAVFDSELRTLDFPILTVTSVHEDIALPHTYGSSALLVVGTGYEVVKPRGIIRRLNGGTGLPWNWDTGSRAIKIVYTAGYTVATVPYRIRGVAIGYAGLIWEEHKRGGYGISGQTDALGNFTRFAMPTLNDDMKDRLADEKRPSFWTSGERDA